MSSKKDGATIVGVGAAACAACCVGPILGFLAALGVGGVVGFAVFGVVGLAIAAVIGLVLYRRRRRRATTCTPSPETVMIQPPAATRRARVIGSTTSARATAPLASTDSFEVTGSGRNTP